MSNWRLAACLTQRLWHRNFLVGRAAFCSPLIPLITANMQHLHSVSPQRDMWNDCSQKYGPGLAGQATMFLIQYSSRRSSGCAHRKAVHQHQHHISLLSISGGRRHYRCSIALVQGPAKEWHNSLQQKKLATLLCPHGIGAFHYQLCLEHQWMQPKQVTQLPTNATWSLLSSLMIVILQAVMHREHLDRPLALWHKTIIPTPLEATSLQCRHALLGINSSHNMGQESPQHQ